MTPKNNNSSSVGSSFRSKKNDEKSKRKSKRDPDTESESSDVEEEWETESSSSSEDSSVRHSKKSKKSKKHESSEEEDEEDEKFDKKKYRKFLSEMFPSKYSKKNAAFDDEETEESEDSEISEKRKSAKHKKSKHSKKSGSSKKNKSNKTKYSKKSSKKQQTESESEDDEYDSEEDEYSDSDEEDEENEQESDDDSSDSDESSDSDSEDDDYTSKKDGKINIILSVGGKTEQEEYEDYFGNQDDEEDESEEDDECNTDDEETFMKEKYEKIVQPELSDAGESGGDSGGDSDENKKKKNKKSKNDKKKDKKKKDLSEKEEDEKAVDVESEYIELLELKKDLTKKLHKNSKSKILKKAIHECSIDIKRLVKDARKKNTKEYKQLINGDKTKLNEMNYFKTKMSNAEQLKIMRELKEVNQHIDIDKPYRLSLLESNIPPKLKANAMQKINMLRSMDTCDPEYFKIKNWVDTFMRIPFCKYSSLSVTMSDGLDKCHEFMENAKSVLDKCVYGLDDAKLQILQMVGQWISNPDAMGTAIAIKGPPGTGKTTLVKDGISKILGREFVFIPLGGAGDASFLEGHSYTYEGSSWGKIVQCLIDCKCMNPVFYFDELDKISDTPKGEEITGILTHLTDTTQNSQFHDKYFSDVDFDLSKCLFIFSYNDESKVNPILKDRMYRIQTKGYDAKEKIVIANQYMLPKIREQVNFKHEDVIIPDDSIKYIVSSQHLTNKEDGVRNMKRCLEIIHTKLNLFRLVKPDQNIFAKDIDINVQFPFTVTTKDIDILIKNEEKQSQSLLSMYI